MALVLLPITAGATVNYVFGYYGTLGDIYDQHLFPTGSLSQLSRPSGNHPNGLVVAVDIPSDKSDVGAQPASIWLPPQYFETDTSVRFPVVYLYHGYPGTAMDWMVGGSAWQTGLASARADKPVVLVSPTVAPEFSDTECVDGSQGQWDTYLSQDVRDWVVSHAHVLPDAAGQATAGLSMGGFCALAIALRHPDRFSVAGNFSGTTMPTYTGGMAALFGNVTDLVQVVDSYTASKLIQNPATHGVKVWTETGSTDDPNLIAMEKDWTAQAESLGLTAVFNTLPGSHSFYVWSQSLRDFLPWALARLAPANQPIEPLPN